MEKHRHISNYLTTPINIDELALELFRICFFSFILFFFFNVFLIFFCLFNFFFFVVIHLEQFLNAEKRFIYFYHLIKIQKGNLNIIYLINWI